jgi:hypothetical protein
MAGDNEARSRQEKLAQGVAYRKQFMSDEQIKSIDEYLTRIEQNRSNLSEVYQRWQKEEEAYAMEQPLDEDAPNSRVNILQANIEGQVNALVEHNLAVVCRGEGPSDQSFARWAQIGLDWAFRKNDIKEKIRRFARRFELFGPAWFKVTWDADAIDGFGLPVVTCPPLQNVFIDMKVTDHLDVQKADYIAECILMSKTQAEKRYGEAAQHIMYGGTDRATIFTKEKTTDDDEAFWLIQLWTMDDDKLRLREFSDDGVLLKDSFCKWENGKFVEKENPKPYYQRNQYCYFLTVLYTEEGKLFGFGDGKLLRPLQDLINDLYDQIRQNARPDLILVDPSLEVELEDIENPKNMALVANLSATAGKGVQSIQIGRVNESLWRLLDSMHREVQRVTRFSELMLGQNASSDTATEAAIQQQQGMGAIDHKKGILQGVFTHVAEYMLSLMMEHYTEAKAFAISERPKEFEWIDFRQMNNVPVMIPSDTDFLTQFRTQNPEVTPPKWMQLTDKDGKPMNKSVDLDIEITLGAGLPKNKAFLYQMAERLSKIVVPSMKDGIPRSAIMWEELRSFLKDFCGIPLQDVDPQTIAPQTPQGGAGATPQMPSADTVGMTQNGAPQTGNLQGRTMASPQVM